MFLASHSNCKFGDKCLLLLKKLLLDDIPQLKEILLKCINGKQMAWKVIVVWADCQLEPRRKKSKVRERTLINIITN